MYAGHHAYRPRNASHIVAVGEYRCYRFPILQSQGEKLVRKIDLVILPLIVVNYIFFYVDKTTLSYAAIFGVTEDLHLHGKQYSWLSSLFYFGFLAWSLPTNLLMQRLPLGKYLGFNIFLWGFFLMLQSSAKSFTTLGVLRALAGAAEACSDPSFILITSMWYTRNEQPQKLGLWYSAIGAGIAIGGLLGYGIGHIKGSLPSWKYEFLIIGALCSTWGIMVFIFMPDNIKMAIERLKENQTGMENNHFKLYQVWEALMDPKTRLLMFFNMTTCIPNGGISNFGTLIVKGFGFSTLITTIMQIPYGVLIILFILGCMRLNKLFPNNNRCLLIILFTIPNIIGAFGMRYVAHDHKAGRYICYLLTAGYNASYCMILSLQIANTAGHTKKIVTSGVAFLGYSAGNIAGPFIYKASQAPTMIVCHLAQIVAICLWRFLMSFENRRRDKIQAAQEGGLAARDLDATAFGDLTDRENMNFRYIY
ncbi:major facilitator superfamily domain-containing protein [Exophiala viscosa]|uniref:major facilitator superfamily domain-containing protein n=1 Tax=Exophiala viscosa TaxID=2486360 RepID=UPI002197A391|nr:major facilitator superfamily domain-containing protein [Exophiala viscosa]